MALEADPLTSEERPKLAERMINRADLAERLRDHASDLRSRRYQWVRGLPEAAGTACALYKQPASYWVQPVLVSRHEVLFMKHFKPSIVHFNDFEARSADEVAELLEKAAAWVEEQM